MLILPLKALHKKYHVKIKMIFTEVNIIFIFLCVSCTSTNIRVESKTGVFNYSIPFDYIKNSILTNEEKKLAYELRGGYLVFNSKTSLHFFRNDDSTNNANLARERLKSMVFFNNNLNFIFQKKNNVFELTGDFLGDYYFNQLKYNECTNLKISKKCQLISSTLANENVYKVSSFFGESYLSFPNTGDLPFKYAVLNASRKNATHLYAILSIIRPWYNREILGNEVIQNLNNSLFIADKIIVYKYNDNDPLILGYILRKTHN